MPWKLNHSELNPQVEDENDNYVCQVWGTGTPEGRRNARLICAAPEMYRLLRRALPARGHGKQKTKSGNKANYREHKRERQSIMPVLLRCPFCGGKPVIVVHHTKLYGECRDVICSECEATISDLWDYTKEDNGIRKRDAVEVWNSRVK